MSFARSVLQSRQTAVRSIAPRISAAVASNNSNNNAVTSTASFWSTAPVQQEEPKEPVKTFTTADIVRTVAETHDLSLAESKRIFNTIFDSIVENLADKKVVRVSGFGTFETYISKAYTARNPRTGEPLLIPPKDRARFRPHGPFKKNIKSGSGETSFAATSSDIKNSIGE